MKHHILSFLLTALLLTSCEPTDPTQLVWWTAKPAKSSQ